MNFNDFFKFCKDLDILKSMSIYVVTGWVLLQAVSLLAEPLKLPSTALSLFLILLLLGFPLYGFFLWKTRVQHNEQALSLFQPEAASAKDGGDIGAVIERQIKSRQQFTKLYLGAIGTLAAICILAILFIVRANFFNSPTNETTMPMLPLEMEAEAEEKIAILSFENNTGDTQLDVLSKMAVDWILHGITQNDLAKVISPETIADYKKVVFASVSNAVDEPQTSKRVNDLLKPTKVLTGSYYKLGNKLLFQAKIMDRTMVTTLATVGPVETKETNPLEGIEDLKQQILGHLFVENKSSKPWQVSPPNFEAYKTYIESKSHYDDNQLYLDLLNKAIHLDSTFFDAQAALVEHYYNQGSYKIADSLINKLSAYAENDKRQWNLIKMYQSLIQGNNGDTYKYLQNEFQIAPDNFETNSSYLTVALQFVNKPEEVERIFKEINISAELNLSEKELQDCVFCEYQYQIKGWASNELGHYEEVLQLLQPFYKSQGDRDLKKALLRAMVRSDKPMKDIKETLSRFKFLVDDPTYFEILKFTAGEFLLLRKENEANLFFEQFVNEFNQHPEKDSLDLKAELSEVLLLLVRPAEALNLISDYLEKAKNEVGINELGLAAIIAEANKKKELAEEYLNQLKTKERTYEYGRMDYVLAKYYAYTKQKDLMYFHLNKAVADGKWFDSTSFHNDFFFTDYKEDSRFKSILTYWH